MNGLFVVGTDTGVGKTVASGAIVAALKAKGVDASYMKPVGSDGVDVHGRLVSPDALWVAEIAGLDDPWDLINPICLPGALSPLAAAEACGRDIDLAEAEAAWKILAERHDVIVVEGVGGLLAPLTSEKCADYLNEMFDLPVVVAARPGLGTINHTLMTIEALKTRNASLLGFFYCHDSGDAGDFSMATNSRHTRLFTDIPFLGSMRHVVGLDSDKRATEKLVAAIKEVAEHLDF